MSAAVMSPEQLRLARHALGLPNARRRSYRNRFFASPGGFTHAVWMDMVAKGWAGREGPDANHSKLDFFWLTRDGAGLAKKQNEDLCREDFQTLKPATSTQEPAP